MITLEDAITQEDAITLEDLTKIYNKCKNLKGGKNADYIPELAKVNPHLFAISICTVNGLKFNVGDYKKEIAIESVSKVFNLALALKELGSATLKKKIGTAHSNQSFNSIQAVITHTLHTINSFDNGGAMATVSLLYNSNQKLLEKKMYDNICDFAGRKLNFNEKVYHSEIGNLDQNLSIAYLLKHYNRFYAPDVMRTVQAYTRMCSVNATSADLAVMAATLANNGVNPLTLERCLPKTLVPYIIDHMVKNGMYTESPEWHDRIGLPAKSGVGGAIIMVVPGVMGIAIVSPPLNKAGNSFKGSKAAILLSDKIREQA